MPSNDQKEAALAKWKLPPFFDSAVVIGALTAFAYASGFAFECAYLSFFGIPLELVQVEIRSVLSLSAAASVLLGLVHLWNPLPTLYAWVPEEVRDEFAIPLWLTTLGVTAVILFRSDLLLFFTALPACKLVASIYQLGSEPGEEWLGRLISIQRRRQLKKRKFPTNDFSETVVELVKRKTGLNFLTFVLTVVSLVLASYIIGLIVALQKSTFLVETEKDHPQCAVLTIYGSTAVCKDFSGYRMQDWFRTFELTGKDLKRIRLD